MPDLQEGGAQAEAGAGAGAQAGAGEGKHMRGGQTRASLSAHVSKEHQNRKCARKHWNERKH